MSSHLDVTVQGFDVHTGATTWSDHLGNSPAAVGFGADTIVRLSADVFSLNDFVGHTTAINMRTGAMSITVARHCGLVLQNSFFTVTGINQDDGTPLPFVTELPTQPAIRTALTPRRQRTAAGYGADSWRRLPAGRRKTACRHRDRQGRRSHDGHGGADGNLWPMATRAEAPQPTLLYVIKQVELAVRARLDDILRPAGLTVLQYTALTVLERHPDLTSAQLARNSFVTAQTMADMVVILCDRGLIDRHRDAADRRRLVLALTADGRKLLKVYRSRVADLEAEMVAPLTARQAAQLRGEPVGLPGRAGRSSAALVAILARRQSMRNHRTPRIIRNPE